MLPRLTKTWLLLHGRQRAPLGCRVMCRRKNGVFLMLPSPSSCASQGRPGIEVAQAGFFWGKQRAAGSRNVPQRPRRALSTQQLPAELPTTALPLLLQVFWDKVWSRMRCAPSLSLPSSRGFGQSCVEQQPCNSVKQDCRNLILKNAQISRALAGVLHAGAHLSMAWGCSVMFTCGMQGFTPEQT